VQWCLRLAARRRISSLEAGAVTVVIASWNAPDMLEVALAAVRRFADRPTRIRVIDNHSRITPKSIADRFGAQLVRLPANTGHAMALDIGFLLARTEFVMSLDTDAFPYSRDWMPTFLDPLDDAATVVGCDWFKHYAHPCCLAMRTEHFVKAGHSFKAKWDLEIDVGQTISTREGPDKVRIIPKTGNIAGTGYVGASYGDVLYHNAYGTRHLRLHDPENDMLDVTETWATKREHALAVWRDGLARFGPATWNGPV
jgi:glycosyltransferase involved in cell wall biosynthesis